MAAFIVSYEEAVALGPTTVGGKGWNLGRLHRYGFAVPTGGILIAQAYTQFMQDQRVRALCADLAGVQIGDVADTEVADKLRALRVTIEATVFSTDVEEAVHTFLAEAELAEVPVAVRSSATTEDSAAASFAGIHESVLNVAGHQEVLQAIKGCYASLWTPHALAYRRQRGLADEAVACAVLICAMITGPGHSPPGAAGRGFAGSRVINAGCPLGADTAHRPRDWQAHASSPAARSKGRYFLPDLVRYPVLLIRRVGWSGSTSIGRGPQGAACCLAHPDASRCLPR